MIIEIVSLTVSTLVTIITVVVIITRINTRIETRMERLESDIKTLTEKTQRHDDHFSTHLQDRDRHIDPRSWDDMTSRWERLENKLDRLQEILTEKLSGGMRK